MSTTVKALKTYRTKRDFTRTREPSGKASARVKKEKQEFVVQKHAASHLHFDLRLESGGVMKSWAVPKGPSLDPRDKRLAMQVEDHPIEYNKLEGTIPKGEYGGGTVMIWDRGTYEPKSDGAKASIEPGLRAGKVEFTLHGEKLRGLFALVRMARGDGREWLLIKQSDEFAAKRPVTSDRDKSVVSGRTMNQIAGEKGGATSIAPMLATSASEMPTGEGWEFEPKYDGIRILAFATSDDTRLITRNGIDKSAQFPEIASALQSLSRKRRASLVLDGEIVALEGKELGRFQALQGRVHRRDRGTIAAAQDSPAVMVLFDILMRGDLALANEPWTKRRKALEAVAKNLDDSALRLGEAEVGDGTDLLHRAEREGWEGLMAKRVDSAYAAGKRTRDWLKIKLENQQEFVVGGWTEPRNSRQHFGALLIGYFANGKLVYAGHVGGGFSDDRLREVFSRLRALERKTSPFDVEPSTNQPAHWVKPDLVVQVKFNEWTRGGQLRQPVFLGLRDDKDATQVTRELPVDTTKNKHNGAGAVVSKPAKAASSASEDVSAALTAIEEGKGDGDVVVESSTLHVTNLSKVYFRKARKTKGDVLRYYDRMAPLLLPHLMDRPLVLRRYPDGIDKPAFFQQRASDDTPDDIRTAPVAVADKGKERRIIGGDLLTLLYCAQLGGIDMNPWHSRIDSLGEADYSILDLDPGPRAPFSRVVEVARVVHDVLDAFGLHAAVKTSGASGIHVVVPLPPGTSYQSSLLLAQVVATETAAASPKHATVVRKVSDRGAGQVYVDYLQNVQGKSVASVLSLRAQPLASVSMPIGWEELDSDLDPGNFTIDVKVDEAESRMQEWSEILAHPADLSVFTSVV